MGAAHCQFQIFKKSFDLDMKNSSNIEMFIAFLVLLNTQMGGASPNGNRIINGLDASKNQYPWLVYITAVKGAFGSSCGGTVLNPRYVLTAAHCMFRDIKEIPGFRHPFHASEIKVYAGAHNRNFDMMRLDGVQEVGVSTYVNHPGFKPRDSLFSDRWDNDYSIMELTRNIIPTTTVREACLSIPLDVGFEPVIAAGWGKTGDGIASMILKHVELKTITRSNCASNYDLTITKNMLCTTGWDQGTCSGDSGGPLMAQDGKVIGVTSWGNQDKNGKCLTSYPSVFARVTPQMIDWIKKNTQGNICVRSI